MAAARATAGGLSPAAGQAPRCLPRQRSARAGLRLTARSRRAGLRPISNLGAAMLLEFRLRGARGQRRRRVVRLALRASNPILHNSFQARG